LAVVHVPTPPPLELPDELPLDEPLLEPLELPDELPLDEPLLEPLDEPLLEPLDEPLELPLLEPLEEPLDEPLLEPLEEPLLLPELVLEPLELPEDVEDPLLEPLELPEDVDDPLEDDVLPLELPLEEPLPELLGPGPPTHTGTVVDVPFGAPGWHVVPEGQSCDESQNARHWPPMQMSLEPHDAVPWVSSHADPAEAGPALRHP